MATLVTNTVVVTSGQADLVSALTAAASGGDTAEVGPGLMFVVSNNGSGATRTATFDTPGTVQGLAISNASLAVASGAVGIMPLHNVFRGSTDRASVTYDSVTDLTVGVFKVVS